jgi:hypothetical protein
VLDEGGEGGRQDALAGGDGVGLRHGA